MDSIPDHTGQFEPLLRDGSYTVDPTLDVSHPLLKCLLSIYKEAKGARLMPSRQELDPIDLPTALLPNLLLIDVEAGPSLRFRWRLIGTTITRIMGRDSTGKFWDELYDADVLSALSETSTWVVENRRPLRTVTRAPIEERNFQVSENLELPLSEDGVTVSMIMVAAMY